MSSPLELPGADQSGILAASWHAWPNHWALDGIHLFLEGFAGPADGSAKSGDPEKSPAFAIIESYKQQGTEFLASLRGSFALALWDSANRKLGVATDHFGTRSVYYWIGKDQIAFSPRLTHLSAAPEVDRTIDPNSVYFYLNHSCIAAPFTIFKSIRRLEPGQLLCWSNRRLTCRSYWDMAYNEDEHASEAAAAANIRESLSDSVRFAFANKPYGSEEFGAFLSGGTDSSALVGLLSQCDGRVKCFSVGFDEAAYNEIEYARIAAKHFRCEAHEYFVKPAEALAVVDRIARAYEEPFGNSSAIPTFFCLKMAREEGVKVMFAGDGGDELFGGNERYITEKVFTLYHRIPWLLRAAIDCGADLAPSSYPWRKLKNYVRKAKQSPIERFFAYQLYFREHAEDYLTDEFTGSLNREFPLEVPSRHYARAGSIAALNRLLYVDLKLAISDNDLFKVNRMAAAQDMLVLYPYLDPRVGEVSGRIPADFKIKGWTKRYIFKKAFEKFLPKEILTKKKHGFGLPTGDWLRHHKGFKDLARSLLLDARSLQRGYFRRSGIERLLQMHDQETSSYYGSHIWNLMMLELWHRKYADKTAW